MKKIKLEFRHIFLTLVLTSTLLVSCGTVPGLSGAGGLSTPEATLDVVEITPTSTSIPTLAPPPPATGQIVFVSASSGQKKLYLMNADGSNLRPLTTGGSEEESPRWSPDGTRIVYVSTVDQNTDIYAIDPGTNASTRLTTDPARDAAPSWSPEGNRIAFESFQTGVLQIYVVNVDGSGLTRLTNDPAAATNPAWSPDGDRIAFMSSQDSFNAALYLILTGGTELFRLTNETYPNSDPVWSPDGSMIAFRAFPSPSVANICVINRDGSNQRCLTNSQWINGVPAWSPDGQRLAVRSERGGISGIDLINVLDGALESLSVNVQLKGDPIWSSGGTRLVFEGCPVTGQNLTCADNTGIELYEIVLITGQVNPLTNTSSYSGQPDWTAR